MNTHQNMEDRLWDFIDGQCTAEEKSFIEELIATDQAWKAKYGELLEVHQMLNSHLELDEPSLRFTRNVMEEIGKFQIAPAARNYINNKIIWGIGIFFLAMIAGLIIYSLGQINWGASDSGNFFDMSNLNIGRFLNNTYMNIFMMVNVVLGLMLLDMYLGKRKKQIQEKQAG